MDPESQVNLPEDVPLDVEIQDADGNPIEVPEVEQPKDTPQETEDELGDLNPDDYLVEDEPQEDPASETPEETPEGEGEDEVNPLEARLAELEAQLVMRDVYAAVGGEEAYAAMAEQARSILTPAEQAAYDDMVVNGTTEQALFAVKALKALIGANDEANIVTYGGGVPEGNENRFIDEADLLEAMSDPRYNTDAAYTERVVRKLANSPHINF